MPKKTTICYTEQIKLVKITAEIETIASVGDTLKLSTENIVPRYCYRVIGKESLENEITMRKAFQISEADLKYNYWSISDYRIVVPPYLVGRIKSVSIDVNKSECSPEKRYQALYEVGFDVDYGDGAPPKHYYIKTHLHFDYKVGVPYEVNSMEKFVAYKEWVKRRREYYAKNIENWGDEWEKSNPCPM